MKLRQPNRETICIVDCRTGGWSIQVPWNTADPVTSPRCLGFGTCPSAFWTFFFLAHSFLVMPYSSFRNGISALCIVYTRSMKFAFWCYETSQFALSLRRVWAFELWLNCLILQGFLKLEWRHFKPGAYGDKEEMIVAWKWHILIPSWQGVDM